MNRAEHSMSFALQVVGWLPNGTMLVTDATLQATGTPGLDGRASLSVGGDRPRGNVARVFEDQH